jgi:starch phosphorylase
MDDVQELDQSGQASADATAILRNYGCSAATFAGAPDALYERHLKFDNIVDPSAADASQRYGAAARAVNPRPNLAGRCSMRQ